MPGGRYLTYGLVAVLTAYLLSPPASAQKARPPFGKAAAPKDDWAQYDRITVVACNKAGKAGPIAVYYQEDETVGWVSRGWFTVERGQCKTLFYSASPTIYLATTLYVGGSSASIGSNAKHCTVSNRDFAIYDKQLTSKKCPAGARMDSFKESRTGLEPGGVYTYNF